MKYELAIFDLDGTILNTIDDLADSINETLKKFNFPLHTVDEVKFMVGNGIPKLVERAIPNGKDNPYFDEFFCKFVEYYNLHKADKTAPYDGILEVLKTLKERGYKLAVNSNKLEEAVIPLCKQYFPDIFDFYAGAHLDKPTKPDPYGVNSILAKAKVERSKAVYIGDSDVDMQTAKNSGLTEIGCAWGFRGKELLRQYGATNIVESPVEILNLL